MTRFCLASAAALLVAATSVHAQTPAPTAPVTPQTITLNAGLKRFWDGIKRNVSEAAEKMPEANYSFKPTPDVRSFGELVGHVAESQHGMCLGLKGEKPPFERGSIEKKTTKAELVKALQDAIAACDSLYGTATDESLVKMTKFGPAQEAAPINILWYNISHSNEHYGNMVTYMRLKGLVPPSTERAQAPRKPSQN